MAEAEQQAERRVKDKVAAAVAEAERDFAHAHERLTDDMQRRHAQDTTALRAWCHRDQNFAAAHAQATAALDRQIADHRQTMQRASEVAAREQADAVAQAEQRAAMKLEKAVSAAREQERQHAAQMMSEEWRRHAAKLAEAEVRVEQAVERAVEQAVERTRRQYESRDAESPIKSEVKQEVIKQEEEVKQKALEPPDADTEPTVPSRDSSGDPDGSGTAVNDASGIAQPRVAPRVLADFRPTNAVPLCGINGCVLAARHAGLCAIQLLDDADSIGERKRRKKAATGSVETSSSPTAQQASEGRHAMRRRDSSGTSSRLDEMDAEFPVDEPDQHLFCRIGRADTGGKACVDMLRSGFTSVDDNMINLRGSTYAAARRVVLFQRREGLDVVIASAVIRLPESHDAPSLEIPILVVASSERKKGYGRLFVDALRDLGVQFGCKMAVAWAAGRSLGFWERVGLHEKQAQASDAALRQAISRYNQKHTGVGFADTKMVATLL